MLFNMYSINKFVYIVNKNKPDLRLIFIIPIYTDQQL